MINGKSAILTYDPVEYPGDLFYSSGIEVQKKVYLETYGCQMNLADTRIIISILRDSQYGITDDPSQADVILINTCAIRDNAVQRVFKRMKELKFHRKRNPGLILGITGCIAEHSKEELFVKEPALDLIAGPDSYRHLPGMIQMVKKGQKIIDTDLFISETYESLIPSYTDQEISAFVTIMRGCNNFCSYCVVPAARGRERSRKPENILEEIGHLTNKGCKEITLLGQNVNSYTWGESDKITFAGLLSTVATVFPAIRFRFATSHPKDIDRDIIQAMADHSNICKHIHLALQSGSDRILKLMNRKYNFSSFIEKVKLAREIIPEVSITTDIIAGFCSETEEDHQATISAMEKIRFDFAYMFRYSEREGTYAFQNLKDDVEEVVKKKRLNEIIHLQTKHSLESNKKDIEKIFNILIEGKSKRSENMQKGRNSQNKMIVFPLTAKNQGEYVKIKVNGCTSATLIGTEILSLERNRHV